MTKKMKFAILTSGTVISFIYRFVRLYSATFRLTVEGEQRWMEHIQEGGRVLLCGWHQQFFPVLRYFKVYEPYRASVMISRSSDGEFISGVAKLMGLHPVRGSSSRGGREALAGMIEALRARGLAIHILDGPTGPMGVVKAGAIRLAFAADAVIVPFYTSADRAWYAHSWDRFMVPKPFARVTIRYGDPIPCPLAADSEEFEKQRRALEETMLPGLHRPMEGFSS
ncbi:MAG: lysophospholipid acyltransferase family protein [Deltaproteobacteria bacterium]|nr:lysophospholipid acyltransferase family protein [Deltaproteobacteria bacterium]